MARLTAKEEAARLKEEEEARRKHDPASYHSKMSLGYQAIAGADVLQTVGIRDIPNQIEVVV